MKWFEQNLSGFKIIFLHDPFSCRKCIDVINCEDFDSTPSKYFPLTKLENTEEKLCKGFESKNDVSKLSNKESVYHPNSLFRKTNKLSSVKNNMLKKKKLKEVQALPLNCHKNNGHEFTKLPLKSGKKKTSSERNVKTCKKQAYSPAKKQRDSKVPGKGTLKRKRWFLNKLNNKNDNYEDDLFEDQKFSHFQNLLEDETDNAEKYENLKTPVFPYSISPRESSPSPTYKDCYSPTELSRSRKGAEEYQYRRKKRRRQCFVDNEIEVPNNVDPQSREADVKRRLEEVARILDQHTARTSDSEEDQYFSDVPDNSSKFII